MACIDAPNETNDAPNISKAECDLYIKNNLERIRAARLTLGRSDGLD